MPQLDTSTFTSQLFWLVVCFFSMMFIMSKFIIPKIADIMEQRQRKIDGYLNKAADLKEQAEAALRKYQNALAAATEKADKSLADTKDEMNRLISDKQSELEARLQKKIKEGEKEINHNYGIDIYEIHIAVINIKNKEIIAVSEDLALDVIKKIGISGIKASDIKAAIKDLEN